MSESSSGKSFPWIKLIVFVILVGIIAVGWWQLREVLTLKYLATQEAKLNQFKEHYPYLVYGIAFLVYAVITGLSLPGALPMTILYAWYFGFWQATVLVSFASTTGATLAFLMSRYLFRDFVTSRFGERQKAFKEALEHEGPFFLFTLRAIPLVPFFLINIVMGVTPIGLFTYAWVSQLGMLPGTMVYVYAGSRFPNLQKLADEGVWSAFTTSQTIQILVAFVVIGIFPLLIRGVVKLLKKSGIGSDADLKELAAGKSSEE